MTTDAIEFVAMFAAGTICFCALCAMLAYQSQFESREESDEDDGEDCD